MPILDWFPPLFLRVLTVRYYLFKLVGNHDFPDYTKYKSSQDSEERARRNSWLQNIQKHVNDISGRNLSMYQLKLAVTTGTLISVNTARRCSQNWLWKINPPQLSNNMNYIKVVKQTSSLVFKRWFNHILFFTGT